MNQSNTLIYVQPQDKRQLDNDFKSSKLNLTWVVVSIQNGSINLDLKFDSPLEISPNIL
jgi:hypothetical protein